MIVCICAQINESTIKDLIVKGYDFAKIMSETSACTNCQSCRQCIESMILEAQAFKIKEPS